MAMIGLALAACGSAPTVVAPQASPSVPAISVESQDVAKESTPVADPTATTEILSSAEITEKDEYAIGDVAPVGAFLVRVEELTTTNQTQYGSAQFGNTFALVRVVVENTSSEPQGIDPLSQMVIQDAGGATYPLDGKAAQDFETLREPIEPGGITDVTLGYQVREGSEQMRWVFQLPSVSGVEGEKGVFSIQP
jgi:hypothetical protein